MMQRKYPELVVDVEVDATECGSTCARASNVSSGSQGATTGSKKDASMAPRSCPSARKSASKSSLVVALRGAHVFVSNCRLPGYTSLIPSTRYVARSMVYLQTTQLQRVTMLCDKHAK